ncbi:MAG TPA: response regulator [Puia sp.]|nr:response regulator [Puia sp.]
MTVEFPYIILVEDDPDDREFFCAAMQRIFPQVRVRTFQDGNEFLAYLNDCPLSALPACIVIDYKMPLFTAPQLLRLTGAGTRYDQIPKVVWSTSKRLHDIEECLRFGAIHFATKPDTDRELDNLIRSFNRWLVRPPRAAGNFADGKTMNNNGE